MRPSTADRPRSHSPRLRSCISPRLLQSAASMGQLVQEAVGIGPWDGRWGPVIERWGPVRAERCGPVAPASTAWRAVGMRGDCDPVSGPVHGVPQGPDRYAVRRILVEGRGRGRIGGRIRGGPTGPSPSVPRFLQRESPLPGPASRTECHRGRHYCVRASRASAGRSSGSREMRRMIQSATSGGRSASVLRWACTGAGDDSSKSPWIRSGEGRLLRQHVIKNAPERIEIGALVERSQFELLGGDEVDRTRERSPSGRAFAATAAG